MTSKTNIKHLSHLANLPLTKEEEQEFATQLPEILGYVNDIQTLDIQNAPETAQVTQKTNEFRQDQIEPSLTQKEALSQARNTHAGFFVVPAVISQKDN